MLEAPPHLSSCSAPAAQTAIVCRVYTRTQKLHYTPSLLTVHPARKQPPCCSAQCLPTVRMSWAWLKWARPAEQSLTASAGTSGAQFCLLSPPIWPCFSLSEQSAQCRWDERANKSWGMDEEKVRQWQKLDRGLGWKRERDVQTERLKDWETETENQSGTKWVIEGDTEKRVERVWNVRREFNLFSGSVVPSQKCVYQPLLCH